MSQHNLPSATKTSPTPVAPAQSATTQDPRVTGTQNLSLKDKKNLGASHPVGGHGSLQSGSHEQHAENNLSTNNNLRTSEQPSKPSLTSTPLPQENRTPHIPSVAAMSDSVASMPSLGGTTPSTVEDDFVNLSTSNPVGVTISPDDLSSEDVGNLHERIEVPILGYEILEERPRFTVSVIVYMGKHALLYVYELTYVRLVYTSLYSSIILWYLYVP